MLQLKFALKTVAHHQIHVEKDKVAVILMRIVEGWILFVQVAQYFVALILTQSTEKNVVILKVIDTSIRSNDRKGKKNIMAIIEKFKFMFDIII